MFEQILELVRRHKANATTMTAILGSAVIITAGCGSATPAVTDRASAQATPSQQATPATSPGATTTATSPTGSPQASASANLTHIRESAHFEPAFSFEQPNGWKTVDDSDRSFRIENSDGTVGIGLHTNWVIGSNDRDCEGLARADGPTTADGIMAALATDPRLEISAPSSITLGTWHGQAADIQVAADWTGTCKWSSGAPAALLLTVADPPGPFFGLLGPERVHLVLLQVGSDLVTILPGSTDGSNFDSRLEQAMTVVQTFTFAQVAHTTPDLGEIQRPLSSGVHTSANFEPQLRFRVSSGWDWYVDLPTVYAFGKSGVYCPDTGPIWGESCRSSEGRGYVAVEAKPVLASDGPACEAVAASDAPMSVTEIIATLAADPRLSMTGPFGVAVGGLEGWALEINVAPTWTGQCPETGHNRAARVFNGSDFREAKILRQDEHWKMILLDVGDQTIAITVAGKLGDAAGPVIDTFEFGE